MTAAEMIEIVQAYERGEEIEIKENEKEDWREIKYPFWVWENFKLRIRPKEKQPKFKIGDVLVRLEYGCKPLGRCDIHQIIKITDKFTLEIESGIKVCFDEEYLNSNFIKSDDVLWFWEYQESDGKWNTTPRRYTKEALKEYLKDPSTATPLYALGFRLTNK